MELVSGYNLFALPLEREWVASPATQEFPNFNELGMNKSFCENIGALFGGFESGDAHGTAGLEVAEGRRHFSEIAKLEGALAEAASGDDGDGVGGAAVDLDERHQALAVCAGGIVQLQQTQSAQGHAQAQNLAGAHVAVGPRGERLILGERVQRQFTTP